MSPVGGVAFFESPGNLVAGDVECRNSRAAGLRYVVEAGQARRMTDDVAHDAVTRPGDRPWASA